MARRFTESEKWTDPWFRALKPECKLAWLYLVDNCDCAGLIDLDRPLADFQIGFDVDWDRFLIECGSRIHKLQTGKLWLVGFIEFQQGKTDLTSSNNCHAGIAKRLNQAGINYMEFGYSIQGKIRGSLAPKEPQAKGREKPGSNFTPPTAAEVNAYSAAYAFKQKLKGNQWPATPFDVDKFLDYYKANGWTQGRGKKIRDWKPAVRNWGRNSFGSQLASTQQPEPTYQPRNRQSGGVA